MKTSLIILLFLLNGCAEKEPHVLEIRAKAGECEVNVDLVIQKKSDLVISPTVY